MHTVARLLVSALICAVCGTSLPILAAAQPAAAPAQQLLKAEELDQLVAPIALYPDALLAEVLMASTYPLEVVQADRWATENKALKGDQLKAAVDKQTWDDSVKSLVATPSVLTMMSTKLDWTQKLGDTVLAQQADVMDAVQRLRTKAQANNKLTSTKEQKVSVTQEQSKQVIVIEPTVPDTVYVPYYDPAVVYGGWPYPAYPPYYFPPPRHILRAESFATGIAFGAGYAVGRWASGGNYWGGGVNWGGNNINVNRSVNVNNVNVNSNNWQHNPAHRQGVKYSNTNVQQKFGNNNIRAGSQDRMDFRGRGGDQVVKPGSGAAGTVATLAIVGRPTVPMSATVLPAIGQTPATAITRRKPSCRKRTQARQRHGQYPIRQSGQRAERTRTGKSRWGRWRWRSACWWRRRRRWSKGGRWRWRPRRWRRRWRRRWTTLRYQAQARYRSYLGHLDNGLGFYRFSYNGSDKAYVGVMAQEVQTVMPDAVVRWSGRVSASFLRQARTKIRDLRPLVRLGRSGSIRCPDPAN